MTRSPGFLQFQAGVGLRTGPMFNKSLSLSLFSTGLPNSIYFTQHSLSFDCMYLHNLAVVGEHKHIALRNPSKQGHKFTLSKKLALYLYITRFWYNRDISKVRKTHHQISIPCLVIKQVRFLQPNEKCALGFNRIETQISTKFGQIWVSRHQIWVSPCLFFPWFFVIAFNQSLLFYVYCSYKYFGTSCMH